MRDPLLPDLNLWGNISGGPAWAKPISIADLQPYFPGTGGGGTAIPYGNATGTNTYVAVMTPVVAAYATGQLYIVGFINANTGASTLDLGPGPKNLQYLGAALVGAEIPAGSLLLVVYDGVALQIIGIIPALAINYGAAIAFGIWN